MAAERWVKPAPKHVRVRDPRYPTLFIPAEGVAVSANDYQIERMIQEGDLVECDPPPPAAEPAADPAPEPAAADEPAAPAEAAPPPASEPA